MTALLAVALLAARTALASPGSDALRAMARAQDPKHLGELKGALASPDPALRAEAAFALGQLGLAEVPDGAPEPPVLRESREEAAAALAPLAFDASAAVRRAAVEALGKVGGPGVEDALRSAAADADAGVRGEAALGLFRTRLLKRVPEYSTAAVNTLALLAGDRDPEVRWRAVYAFTRWPEPRAADALSKAQRSPDARERLFAVRALAKARGAADPALLTDADLYVRAEYAAGFDAPASALADPSPHVRAAAADRSAQASPALEAMAGTDTPMPRGRALIALARLRAPSAAGLLARARQDSNWWVRSRAYEASALLPDAEALLKAGLADPDPRVASSALEALAASTGPVADAALAQVLRDPKAPLELLGTAVDAAAERKPVPVDALLDALKGASPGLTAEVRGSIRKALRDVPAAEAALKSFPEMTDAPRTFPALPGPASVVMETEKGTVELELDAAEAPNHAAAFADSVRRKVYDGTVWHRVVTAFVVQGGDPRGSGWGDDGWRLADEVGRRPFARGTVGMPKAGKDTGGCQLFISLVPTPHLDGRYTAFGRVVSGMEVVDRLEPGDRILSARLK